MAVGIEEGTKLGQGLEVQRAAKRRLWTLPRAAKAASVREESEGVHGD
jgi:hypothetical protein